jgi:undecaprenyl-diphosphatase
MTSVRARDLSRFGHALVVLPLLVLLLAVAGAPRSASAAGGRTTPDESTEVDLGWIDGLVLGVVEGVTEFLPVSSTAHLVVAERLLGLDPPKGSPERDALNSYTIVIQVGAILAVLLLYWRRVSQMVTGLGRRDSLGRRLVLALLIAFVPAGIVAKLLEHTIDNHLLEPGPVAAAWMVGGIALVAAAGWLRRKGASGVTLEQITLRHAAIIGAAQVLALWPGVSRSLVTIAGGLIAGLGIGAAVEFSFLLGLVTLSLATLYELATNGSEIFDRFGYGPPLVGIAAAFVSAAIAVKWLVQFLSRRDLRGFGYYRIAAALLTIVFIATNVI